MKCQSSHSGAAPSPAPVAARYFSDSIPDELQQKVRVQAFIERTWSGCSEVIAIMPAWERPAANLTGVTVSYTNIPNGFLGTSVSNGDQALADSTLFLPMLSDGLSSANLAFSLSGNTVPVPEAVSAMSGTFQQVSEAYGNAADKVAVLGSSTKATDTQRLVR